MVVEVVCGVGGGGRDGLWSGAGWWWRWSVEWGVGVEMVCGVGWGWK